jgi:hypothetical protein
MKALTVQQPWAWAIVHGGKDVENRTQAWTYRGPLAIHAGQRLSERGRESPLVVRAVGDAMRRDQAAHFEYGSIIGVVDLVQVHAAWACVDAEGSMCSPWAEFEYAEHATNRKRRDIAHLVLENPQPLEVPVPCRGALGLWTVPSGVDDQVQLQLEGAA